MRESQFPEGHSQNHNSFEPHNPPQRRFEILHPLGPDYDSKERPSSVDTENTNESAEKQELLDLALAKLAVVQDKAQMEAVMSEFNSHFDYSQDIDQPSNIKNELLISLPEGDFSVCTQYGMNKGKVTKKLIAFELPAFEIGDKVKVDFGDQVIDPDWEIFEHGISDTSSNPERVLKLRKTDSEGKAYTRTVKAKDLRKANF